MVRYTVEELRLIEETEWAMTPFGSRPCPECTGRGWIVGDLRNPKDACRCGGSGKLIDNINWLIENGFAKTATASRVFIQELSTGIVKWVGIPWWCIKEE